MIYVVPFGVAKQWQRQLLIKIVVNLWAQVCWLGFAAMTNDLAKINMTEKLTYQRWIILCALNVHLACLCRSSGNFDSSGWHQADSKFHGFLGRYQKGDSHLPVMGRWMVLCCVVCTIYCQPLPLEVKLLLHFLIPQPMEGNVHCLHSFGQNSVVDGSLNISVVGDDECIGVGVA